MDMEVLKKKISTFRGDGGRVRITDTALLMEILVAWEQWPGPQKEFYRSIGVSQRGMASIIGRAKKLRRQGQFSSEEFKEIKLAELPTGASTPLDGGHVIELTWENGRLIRFGAVELLVDFLKKVA